MKINKREILSIHWSWNNSLNASIRPVRPVCSISFVTLWSMSDFYSPVFTKSSVVSLHTEVDRGITSASTNVGARVALTINQKFTRG